MNYSASAIAPTRAKPVGMPRSKEFETAIHVRLVDGQKARIEALRGETPQAAFVRGLIEDGLQRLEADATSSAKKAD